MHARILDTLEALEPYREAWARATAPTPFATCETYERWMAHQPRHTRPFLVVVLDDSGRLVALAPWIRRKEGGLRRVSGIRDAWYQDPLFLEPDRAPEAARLIVSALRRAAWRWDLLELNLQEGTSAPLLGELAGLGRAHVQRMDGWQTRLIRLGDDWEAYWRGRSDHLRRAARRHQKKLETVEHRLYAADASNLEGLLEETFERHAARWVPTARRNWKAYYGMYRAMAEQALARGELYLFVLEIEGRPVAFDLSMRHGDWGYGLLKIYDPAFSGFSPGHVLTVVTLHGLFERGVRQIDPGGGDDPWKEALKTASLATFQPTVASPASPLGNAVVAWQGRLRPWLQAHGWLVWTVKGVREAMRRLPPQRAIPRQLPL